MARYSPALIAAGSLIGAITCNSALNEARKSFSHWSDIAQRCAFCEQEWVIEMQAAENELPPGRNPGHQSV